MGSESIFALMLLVLAGLLIQQLGLAPRVRSLAWTCVAILIIAWLGLRVLPHLRA